MRVLIVDDDPSMTGLMEEYLSERDFDIQVAHNGDDGMALTADERFDLAIIDIFMPEKNGLSMIMELREKSPDTKIIAISGMTRTGTDFLGAAENLGSDLVLEKPFVAEEFIQAVNKVLGK